MTHPRQHLTTKPTKGLDYIQRQVANSQLAIFVFGGAILEVLLSLKQIPLAVYYFASASIILLPTDALSAVSVFVVPLVYCSIISSYVSPKRIVSPLLVQVGAVLIASVFILNGVYAEYQSISISIPLTTVFAFTAVSLGISVGLWAVVGLLQGFFVRWLVGLNLLSINEKRYGLNAPMDAIISTFEDNESYLMRKVKEVDEAIEGVRLFKAEIPTGEVIILAMREDLTQTGSTILATAAYETGSTSMRETKRASETRDAIVLQILGSLSQMRLGTSMTVLGKDEDDIATKQAYLKATEPTLSKIEVARVFFKELPKYFQYAIASTLALLFAITILSAFDLAKFDYVDAVILLFVALVVELGVSIRQERSKTKRP